MFLLCYNVFVVFPLFFFIRDILLIIFNFIHFPSNLESIKEEVNLKVELRQVDGNYPNDLLSKPVGVHGGFNPSFRFHVGDWLLMLPKPS